MSETDNEFLVRKIPAVPETWQATVISVVDGDTIKVHVPGFPAPFDPIDVRVYGIDTPEHIKPPAKTIHETVLGKAATAFAMTLIKPNDIITISWDGIHHDKYGRLLGTVTLPNGSSFGDAMVAKGVARVYFGGTKSNW